MLKVSIITASYNSVRTISDSIESVMMQTYENIEYMRQSLVIGSNISLRETRAYMMP